MCLARIETKYVSCVIATSEVQRKHLLLRPARTTASSHHKKAESIDNAERPQRQVDRAQLRHSIESAETLSRSNETFLVSHATYLLLICRGKPILHLLSRAGSAMSKKLKLADLNLGCFKGRRLSCSHLQLRVLNLHTITSILQPRLERYHPRPTEDKSRSNPA